MFGMGQDLAGSMTFCRGSFIFQNYASWCVRVEMILFVLFDGFLMCDVLFLCV